MFDGFHARNCALIASIPSGIFSGDGTYYPGMAQGDHGKNNKIIGVDQGTELVGYFNPNDTGSVVGSTYGNLVDGQSDLVIYNGMSYTTGFIDGRGFHSEESGAGDKLTRYFEADGVDDFLGPLEATNYDDFETGLHLNYGGAWHMSMWVNFSEQDWNGSGSRMFSVGPQGVMEWRGFATAMRETGFDYDFADQVTQKTSYSFIKPVEKDRWYFVSFENNGDKSIEDATVGFTMAVDGKVLPHYGVGGPYARQMENDALYVGASFMTYQVDADTIEKQFEYAKTGTKFGEILVYSGDIGINRIIQNYMATRENYNRHSGEKDPFFVEGGRGETFSKNY